MFGRSHVYHDFLIAEKDKKPEKPLDMSQKVYLSACARDSIAPRKKIVSKLDLELLSTRDYLLGPEDIGALSYALTVTLAALNIERDTLHTI